MPTNKKGGYQIVDVSLLTYATALACLKCGKPVLVVNDETNVPYFADSIKIVDSSVIIQKDGRMITIDNDNTITPSGEIGTIQKYVCSIILSGGENKKERLYIYTSKFYEDYNVLLNDLKVNTNYICVLLDSENYDTLYHYKTFQIDSDKMFYITDVEDAPDETYVLDGEEMIDFSCESLFI